MEKEAEMTLSEREWLVLKALWDIGAAELGELTEALRQDTGWSRNTVHTYLTRMEAKGLVRIDKEAYPTSTGRRWTGSPARRGSGTASSTGCTTGPPGRWWRPSSGMSPSPPESGTACVCCWTSWRCDR